MAGKKMPKKNDVSKVADTDKVVIHNKGMRSFVVMDDGVSSTIDPGRTYEVTGKTAKDLCKGYANEIEIVSMNGKAAKPAAADKETEDLRKKVADLEDALSQARTEIGQKENMISELTKALEEARKPKETAAV